MVSRPPGPQSGPKNVPRVHRGVVHQKGVPGSTFLGDFERLDGEGEVKKTIISTPSYSGLAGVELQLIYSDIYGVGMKVGCILGFKNRT